MVLVALAADGDSTERSPRVTRFPVVTRARVFYPIDQIGCCPLTWQPASNPRVIEYWHVIAIQNHFLKFHIPLHKLVLMCFQSLQDSGVAFFASIVKLLGAWQWCGWFTQSTRAFLSLEVHCFAFFNLAQSVNVTSTFRLAFRYLREERRVYRLIATYAPTHLCITHPARV